MDDDGDADEARGELQEIAFDDEQSLLSAVIAGPEDVRAYVAGTEKLTDDRPFMEFVSPRSGGGNQNENLRALARACRQPLSGYAGAEGLPPALRDCRVSRALVEGIIEHSEGRVVQASERYREASRLVPGAARPRLLAAKATVWLAESLLAKNRVDEARRVYEERLAEDPGAAALWLNLGLLHARAGRIDEARIALEHARQDPAWAARATQALNAMK